MCSEGLFLGCHSISVISVGTRHVCHGTFSCSLSQFYRDPLAAGCGLSSSVGVGDESPPPFVCEDGGCRGPLGFALPRALLLSLQASCFPFCWLDVTVRG